MPDSNEKRGMLQRTGVTEGFYRRAWGSSQGAGTGNAGPDANESRSFAAATPVAPESMERSSGPPPSSGVAGEDDTNLNATNATVPPRPPPRPPTSGNLMAPGDLGLRLSQTDSVRQLDAMAQQQQQQRVVVHPTSLKVQQRANKAIRKSLQIFGTTRSTQEMRTNDAPSFSKVAAFTYRGMEVIFGTTETKCYGMCARTRYVFQTLDLTYSLSASSSSSSNVAVVLSIHSHATTGQVVVALSDGTLLSFAPQPVDPTVVSFGRYRWWNGPMILAKEIFYGSSKEEQQTAHFAACGDDKMDVSLSSDCKILVAHRSQLAVLDAAPASSSSVQEKQQQRTKAELLWTTRLSGKVVTAKLSGDAEVIALVLEQPPYDENGEDDLSSVGGGVHTFEHDHDDGGSLSYGVENVQQQPPRPVSLSRSLTDSPFTVMRSRSVGLVYKPGPFLVHAAPVTRLSFRGLGHCTSGVVQKDGEQGNDLLLTYCNDNHVAKIFCQNSWRPLTEWTTPPRTRVDWIRGVAAFTLGDLETQKKPKKSGSSVSPLPSRRPSLNSAIVSSGEAESISESLGKRQHYQSIPSHTTPSSNSGAWISEITFEGRSPAIRLSRLTYLKRGMDELNPSLFENVSSYLPPGFLFEEPVLRSDEAVFSIEGIWPAWNPWLSESGETDITETLRGSAMAFLGLSAGPGAANGRSSHFGNSLLGSTQSPPSELRVVASHPCSGKLVALEFPLLGDPDWSALELGNPRKSVLMLADLDDKTRVEDVVASMDYESSRLVARAQENSKRATITWQKQGSLSLLPSIWLPGDAEPSRAVTVLLDQRCFKDESLIPVPLDLPSVDLPPECSCDPSESILSLSWWPDNYFGSPPLLVALTTAGTIVVFELPPPWSSHEAVTFRNDGTFPDMPLGGGETSGATTVRKEKEPKTDVTYEAIVTPDPEYGLGLRLEVQRDGMPAVAGSFKRHPLTDEALPAEKTNVVNLGDELISANGVSLENKLFDDIIATVRDLGAQSGPGNPIRLKFRHKSPSTPPPVFSGGGPDSPGRRSMEEIIGLKKAQSVVTSGQATTITSLSQLKDRGDMGFVVGVFENAFTEALLEADASPYSYRNCSLVPCNSLENEGPHTFERSSVLFLVAGSKVSALIIRLDLSEKVLPSRTYSLNTWDLPKNGSEPSWIVSADVIKTDEANINVVTCDCTGNVRLVVWMINTSDQRSVPTATHRCFDIFQLDKKTQNIIIRASKVDLIGTMHTNDDGSAEAIHVWSSSPQPVCSLTNDDITDTETARPEYYSSCVLADAGDAFLDFAFVNSGFLDSSQSLVAFSRKKASMFTRQAGSSDWLPSIQISYNPIPGSTPQSSCSDSLAEAVTAGRKGIHTLFPHLVSTMMLAYSSKDEQTFLRSDWHPEALLSQIFTDDRGPSAALNDRVRYLFLWLCSEGKDIPEDHLEAPLVVAPIPILDGTTASADNLLASFVSRTSSEPDEKTLLRRLLTVLTSRCSGTDSTGLPTNNKPASSPDSLYDSGVDLDVPPVVESMLTEDVHILRACCDLLLDPPDFKSIDHMGQHFLSSVALLRKLQSFKEKVSHSESTASGFLAPSVLVKTRLNMKDDESSRRVSTISSSGGLAALLSNSQSRLLELCKSPEHKLDWSVARQLRLPFWVRSDTDLARLSEEVGQTIFREKKDLMECALFFIVSKKMRTLRNLAATDQSESGRKFFKFLTSHDFSSDRGRKAAEKNAFSLLRKCQYRVASAFFLLSEPPAVNSALETIVTKLRDMDLAFLVARLVGSTQVGSATGTNASSISGFGLGGILGGGGGYAGSGFNQDTSLHNDESKFIEWTPTLSPAAQKLLVNRTLPMSSEDPALSALQLLWLDKREEAAWRLSGIVHNDGSLDTSPSIAKEFVGGITTRLLNEDALGRATEKANAIINGVSAPSLLKAMRSSSRARFASALLVASALAAKGLELSAIQTVLQYADPFDPEEKENVYKADASSNVSSQGNNKSQGQECGTTDSSIFESFDIPRPGSISAAPAAIGVQSSIFDSYAISTSIQKKAPTSDVPSGVMQSSVFDAFDAPPKPSSQVAMESSIFDSYEVPPAKPQTKSSVTPVPINTTTASPSGQMQSSIFDDFETTPRQVVPAQAQSSSIFGSYDVPSQASKSGAPSATTGGQMQSSIFDDFDMAPRQAAPAQAQFSSIFDSYDVPSQALKADVPSASSSASVSAVTFLVSNGQTTAVGHLSKSEGSSISVLPEEVPTIGFKVVQTPTPKLWLEWRKSVLVNAAARRLIREVASVLTKFHGDPPDPSIPDFYRSDHPLVPSGASGILQLSCDAKHILGRVQQSLQELCTVSDLDRDCIVQSALDLLGPMHHQQHRTLFAVVLHTATGRVELAEDALRAAAFGVMHLCNSFAFSYDNLVHTRKTRSHAATQFLRRRAARASWQLETCLWLHRGGGLPLSGVALKEAIVAVRVGLLIASWNHNHECLEVMIRSDPDCHLDDEVARQLWTSLKMITSSTYANQLETKKTSSGGWEFLVDCRRSEATKILREKRTGCFIIRPHTGAHGVFTLSFKTNLVPIADDTAREDRTPDTSGDELSDSDVLGRLPKSRTKPVRKDDVVQHAIIRLSESGYRCGSFGPYTTLISLLEAVSDSLPFNLRFDLPPSNRVIKEEGSQPSPNAVFLRKLALFHADSMASSLPSHTDSPRHYRSDELSGTQSGNNFRDKGSSHASTLTERQTSFGIFLELLALSSIRTQLSKVVAAEYDDSPLIGSNSEDEMLECVSDVSSNVSQQNAVGLGSDIQDRLAVVYRTLSPLSTWCRSLEVLAAEVLSPELNRLTGMIDTSPVDLALTADAIEAAPPTGVCSIDGGDALLRRMIQRDSGVEFSTLRLVDGGDCTICVIFSQSDTIRWLVSSGLEETEADALARLKRIENRRVIEVIDLSGLKLKQKEAGLEEGIRYRILDPWEVEALQNWEGETLGASVGRERYLGFNLGKVGMASENVFRSLGGLPLLALWTSTKGGVVLTKALATIHPPWERAAGGDLQFTNGSVTEPPPFENSIRQHLYRNALFRRLIMPQRFMSLIQVELLDLKNLTAPGGSLSMSVYALLRLKREGSTAALANKARTLDTAATLPVKLGKSSGPNAPASWGSVVRFRFPLPENATVDGVSFDSDRELLFKGPPCVLQVSVYEKKLLVDYSLGTADIRTDGLWAGGQLEEWVPLRSEKHGIAWFARIRLTLRFELMCLATGDESKDLSAAAPSVGLRKIRQLCQAGGTAHEDVKRSASSPDLLTYFESMVY